MPYMDRRPLAGASGIVEGWQQVDN